MRPLVFTGPIDRHFTNENGDWAAAGAKAQRASNRPQRRTRRGKKDTVAPVDGPAENVVAKDGTGYRFRGWQTVEFLIADVSSEQSDNAGR
jgi:hypothetical protein